MATAYRFGRFELQPDQRLLVAEGRPVVVHLDGRSAAVALLARGDGCWGRDALFSGGPA